jgi:Domain of unknown function (DUF4337)
MVWDQLNKDADAQNAKARDKLIGVYIGILAVVLAICGMGSGNATQDATRTNIEASNTWAFFQAKNVRRQALRLQADEFVVMLSVNPTMPDEAKTTIKARIKDYRDQDQKLTSDPEKNEGLDELWKKAKALEVDRDQAMKRGPYFDYGQALLQIAIVLASIAIIAGTNLLLFASFLVGVLGAIATLGGFTLAFPLPFAG